MLKASAATTSSNLLFSRNLSTAAPDDISGMAELLEEAGAGFRVEGEEGLTKTMRTLLLTEDYA